MPFGSSRLWYNRMLTTTGPSRTSAISIYIIELVICCVEIISTKIITTRLFEGITDDDPSSVVSWIAHFVAMVLS